MSYYRAKEETRGDELMAKKEWKQAFDAYSRDLINVIGTSSGEEDHRHGTLQAASILNKMSQACRELKHFTAMIDASTDEMNILKHHYPMNHPAMVEAAKNVAWAHCARGDFTKALDMYLSIKEVQKCLLRRDHVEEASVLSMLGYIYSKLGRFSHAIQAYQSCLELQQQQDSCIAEYDVSTTYHALGTLHFVMRNLNLALICLQHCLTIRRSLSDCDACRISCVMCDIADVYIESGNTDQAAKTYMEVMTFEETHGSEQSIFRIIANYNLGLLYRDVGDLDLALRYTVESLNIGLAKLPLPELLGIYKLAGNICLDKGDTSKAQEFFRTTLECCNEEVEDERLSECSELTVDSGCDQMKAS